MVVKIGERLRKLVAGGGGGFHRRKDRSRFTLVLGLSGLAFVTISAGTSLIQAYYSALGILATNGTRSGLNNDVYRQVLKQENILFPLGQALLIVGLAIIFAIFFVQMIFSLRGWAKQRRPMPIVAVIVAVAVFIVWDYVRGGFSTYANLYYDFDIHRNLLPIFFIVAACSGIALYEDGKTRR